MNKNQLFDQLQDILYCLKVNKKNCRLYNKKMLKNLKKNMSILQIRTSFRIKYVKQYLSKLS